MMDSSFQHIAVIGAGTMGAGITQHLLLKGHAVRLVDQDDKALARGVAAIAASMAEAVQRGIIDGAQRDAMLARLLANPSLADLSEADYVVEAIFEDLAVKQKLFAELEAMVPDTCILASNTSSFRITDLQHGLRLPQRVLGVHYFYHAAKTSWWK